MLETVEKKRDACETRILWSVGVWICSALLLVASLISDISTFQVIAVAAFTLFTFISLYNISYHYMHIHKPLAQRKKVHKGNSF